MVIWGQCGGDDAVMQARMEDVLAIMTQAWGPMTDLMGPPLGDANVAGDDLADSPEAGDGQLDVYLVAASVSAHARRIDLGENATALAVTRGAPPFTGPKGAEASSSFIVVNATATGGNAFRSTIVHEFFHSLQFAHNNRGTIVTDAPGAGVGWVRHWFMEASAVWAEHQFVPAARGSEVCPRFTAFQFGGVALVGRGLQRVRLLDLAVVHGAGGAVRRSSAPRGWTSRGSRASTPSSRRWTGRSRSAGASATSPSGRTTRISSPATPIDPMFSGADSGFPDDGPQRAPPARRPGDRPGRRAELRDGPALAPGDVHGPGA